MSRTQAPPPCWHGQGGISLSRARGHVASIDLAVSDDGQISLVVLEAFAGDDPDGPDMVMAVDKAERLHGLLGDAIARAKAVTEAARVPATTPGYDPIATRGHR